MKKKANILCLIASILLILSGCEKDPYEITNGSVKISIIDAIEKNIAPNISLEAEYYIVNGECKSSEKISNLRVDNGKSIIIENLVQGSWLFNAVAYNSEGLAIGKSNDAEVDVKNGKTAELSLKVFEKEGQGTLSVKLDTEDDFNTYTLHLYSFAGEKLSEIGQGVAFSRVDNSLIAKATLNRGYYAFSISCSDETLKLPEPTSFRIVSGDTINESYVLDSKGEIKINIDTAIGETPSITIDIENGIAYAHVSGIESGNLSYLWYADRIKLASTESTLSTINLEEFKTITCIVYDSEAGIIWTQTATL